MIVIDGKNLIFGRAATFIAKKAMQGENVSLVNAEQLVIRGNPAHILDRYKARRAVQNKGTPERSPYWSRVPHMLIKRMLRGMLPRETSRGKDAHKRIMVYSGNPENLKAESLPVAAFDGSGKFMTIMELCKLIGHKQN